MRSRHKNMLIGVLLGIVLVMAVGYAAFAQNLSINSSTSIDSKWNVIIKSIEIEKINKSGQQVDNVNGTASKEFDPSVSVDGTEATFSSILRSPGDSITYKVTIKNEGTLKAKVDSIGWTDAYAESYCMIGETVGQTLCTVDDPIYYSFSGLSSGATLNPNAEQSLTVTASYYDGFTYQPTTLPAYYSTGVMPSYYNGTIEIAGNNYFEKDATLSIIYIQAK